MNNQGQRRRHGIRNVRWVLGVVLVGVLSYTLAGVARPELIAGLIGVLFAVILGSKLYARIESHRRWQFAWERYSRRDVSGKPPKFDHEERSFSLAGTN
jgi:hypothetical protein